MLRCTGGVSFQPPLSASLVKKEEPEVERNGLVFVCVKAKLAAVSCMGVSRLWELVALGFLLV